MASKKRVFKKRSQKITEEFHTMVYFHEKIWNAIQRLDSRTRKEGEHDNYKAQISEMWQKLWELETAMRKVYAGQIGNAIVREA